MIKKFKAFNESTDLDKVLSDLITQEKTFAVDDILYYFADFTDEFEWDYKLENGYQGGYDNIVNSGGIKLRILFKKEFNIEDKIDRTVQFGKELDLFKKCFIQFKEMNKEDIKIIEKDFIINGGSGRRNKKQAEIYIDFIELLPEVIEKFKKEWLEKSTNKSTSKSNDDDDFLDGEDYDTCGFCGGFREVPCISCDGEGFHYDANGNEYNCSECDGDGIIDCPECT